VVNVTDGADVHVRLGPFKLAFCHFKFPSKERYVRCSIFNDWLVIQPAIHPTRSGSPFLQLTWPWR
jgi:hypothetical protein